ncbi:MAG: hypothetical protein ABIZ64_07815 [Casimicrobium sp.]
MKQALALLIVAFNVRPTRARRATKRPHLTRFAALGLGGLVGISAAQLGSQTSAPASAVAPDALPSTCTLPLSANNMQGVANFIWAGCHVLLNWPHDTAPRMSGPSPLATKSVHGYVLNYYSPSVYAWLKSGQPTGTIPDGAVILKQTYKDINGVRGDPTGWALMVKQKSASFDGWYWGYADPKKPSGADGGFGGQFYDPNCVACHGSANTRELTFASLTNIANVFGGTAMPVANGLMGGSLHANVGRLASAPVSAPASGLGAPPRSPLPVIPNHIPSQSNSAVIVGPQGPTGFVTSDVCAGCHDGSNLAFGVQAHMTWPQNLPPSKFPTTPLKNFSPFGEWGASMMGLAARDPVFQAQRESETLTYPSVKNEIDNACYTCHGVMGKRQLSIDKPGALFTHQNFLASSGPDAKYGALARDGVSCLACHRMTPEGLGTQASFTGQFKVTDAKTVFGPYRKVVEYPMQNSVGMTPKQGDAISDPAMCGSCHVVGTAILDAKKTYNEKSFNSARKSHEQTTYLEWLNSSFQTKAPIKPNATPQTCQQCHMPRTMDGAPITTKSANIEDETFFDADGKVFANTAPVKDITMTPRDQYGRHTFVGANVFVLEMFRQFGAQLGLTQVDPNYATDTFKFVPRLDLAIKETTQQMQSKTATVAIRGQRRGADGLAVDVQVVNLTGHKLPSGVGFRRAYIEFTALDSVGNIVWSSGRSTDKGVLIDDNGQPLATEFSKTVWQPHWRAINNSKRVQIYEERTKDVQGLLTTSFFALAKPVKDNRMMPAGWSKNGPYASWTAPFGVSATQSPGYFNGTGSDLVTYVIPPTTAAKVKLVRAVLNYQSIPPYYLQDRFTIGKDNPATEQLRALTQFVDYSNTAVKGWKLPVASAASVVR